MERLCAELIEYFRGLMIVKSVEKPDDLIVAPPAEIARMREEAAAFSLPAILHCMDVLQQSLERLRGGVSRRVEMEMALLKLCTPELDVSPESMLRRLTIAGGWQCVPGQAAGAVSPPPPFRLEGRLFRLLRRPSEPPPPWEEAPPAPSTASVIPRPADTATRCGNRRGRRPSGTGCIALWSGRNDVLARPVSAVPDPPPLCAVPPAVHSGRCRGDLVADSSAHPSDTCYRLARRGDPVMGNKAALTAAIRRGNRTALSAVWHTQDGSTSGPGSGRDAKPERSSWPLLW